MAERARRRSLCGASTTTLVLVGIVDGRDLPVPDADRLVNHLHHRREAVGGAGGRGQQPVPRRVVELVVDADDDVERGCVLDRRRDDDALHAAIEIGLQLIRLEEFAGAFQHDVAAEIAPGHIARRRGCAEAEALVVDDDRARRPRRRKAPCQRP